MAIEYVLHTPGPWYNEHPPMIYNEVSGKFEFEDVRLEEAGTEEGRYVGAKLTIWNLIHSAVYEELTEETTEHKNEIVNAIGLSWVTKVNMWVFSDQQHQLVCNLKIDVPDGAGLEIRQNGEIHYWSPESTDMGDVTNNLKTILKKMIRKAYSGTTGITDPDKRIIGVCSILTDLCNQFGVRQTE